MFYPLNEEDLIAELKQASPEGENFFCPGPENGAAKQGFSKTDRKAA
jgi:hypothetical protein